MTAVQALPSVDDVVRRSPSGKVVHTVRAWIRTGSLRGGEPLPPVRALAQRLEVDKNTVARALLMLRDSGEVRRRGRRLEVVADLPTPPAESSLMAGTVAVFTSMGGGPEHRSRHWPSAVIDGILAELHQRHRHAMVLHPRTTATEQIDHLLAARPMGVIVAEVRELAETEAMLRRIDAAGIPVVTFGSEVGGQGRNVLSTDHEAGAYQLTRWLLEHGRRRIVRYWPHERTTQRREQWLAQRDRGYQRAMIEAGLQPLPPVEYVRPDATDLPGSPEDHFRRRVRVAAGYLVEHLAGPQPADAFLAPSDSITFELAAACRLFGKTPNRDVLLAGYDGYWMDSKDRQYEPAGPAVTVQHDYIDIGRELVRRLDTGSEPSAVPSVSVVAPVVMVVSSSA